MNDIQTELDNLAMDADNDKPVNNLIDKKELTTELLTGSILSTAWDELLKEKDLALEAIIYWIEQHNKLIIHLYSSYCEIKRYSEFEDKENATKLIKEMKKVNGILIVEYVRREI